MACVGRISKIYFIFDISYISSANPNHLIGMRIPAALLLFFWSFCAAAQKPIVQDDFSVNKYGWEESDVSFFSTGEYIINATEDGGQSSLNLFLDVQKDFTISADFIQQNGLEDNGFGLIWASGSDELNLFLISSEGEYAIFSGDPSQLKTWKQHDAIRSIGNLNKLRLESKGGKWIFYINDTKITEHKPMPFLGSSIGFIAFTKMRLSIDNFLFAQDQAIELPTQQINSKKENLGALVNSANDDLGPVISMDGKFLYFARQNVPENVGGTKDDEDVWLSSWENNKWTKAANMGKSVNTTLADNLLAVSADNNTLMFEEENQLQVKHRTEIGWSAAEKLNLEFKNELDHFVACLSADGKAVIFSAKLKSNLFYNPNNNEGDLYVCVKDNDKKWSEPINLGSTINSIGEDTSPFLSADGMTLYFATDGRPGYGNQDIFVTTRVGSSWTEWTKPVNLGPQINSIYFDAYYTIPASGDYAYFVSYDQGFGKADIFKIKLQKNSRPSPVTLVKGKVLNSKTGAPLAASIHFENLRTRRDVGEARSDPKTGTYQIVLPYGINYGVRATRSDFYSIHENLELPVTDEYKEVQKNLLMIPIEVGETIKLNNVFFEAGLAVLKSESFPELDRLVTILSENTGIFIQLEGHTDSRGAANVLLKLSEDRVVTVQEYLVAHGISKNRITGQGYGATRPVATGDSEEDRRLNRRVEFKITKK
jgi:outer membrane protein OmpA-like peptidoglycan-associated protein/Tol biopolymer transport system component